jgi:hypothetical protein
MLVNFAFNSPETSGMNYGLMEARRVAGGTAVA